MPVDRLYLGNMRKSADTCNFLLIKYRDMHKVVYSNYCKCLFIGHSIDINAC